MIELDRTDEEREELVKQWIKDYWLVVVGAVALAIGGLYAFNYYRQSQIEDLSETATATEAVFKSLSQDDVDSATQQVADLQNSDADTTFTAISTLGLGKDLFEADKFSEAATQYNWLIENADDSAMRDIARLRKARADANAQQYAAAIETLNGVENQNYVTESNLLKGDIYAANQQFDEAKKAYESVKEDDAINAQIIQQRLDLLTIKQQKANQ